MAQTAMAPTARRILPLGSANAWFGAGPGLIGNAFDVDISFTAEFDLSPMLQSVARRPEPEGRWWELRQRFTHLGFAQGFDELLCLPLKIGAGDGAPVRAVLRAR